MPAYRDAYLCWYNVTVYHIAEHLKSFSSTIRENQRLALLVLGIGWLWIFSISKTAQTSRKKDIFCWAARLHGLVV